MCSLYFNLHTNTGSYPYTQPTRYNHPDMYTYEWRAWWTDRANQTQIFKMKEKSYIKGSICYINNKCILFTPIRKLWMFFFLTPIYENESIFFLAALTVL